MNKYVKGTVIGFVVISASVGSYNHINEFQKYKNEIKTKDETIDSLRASLDERESKLTLTEYDLSEAKLQLEAEINEKRELNERLNVTSSKYKHTAEEVESLKKTLALLNNELKSKSE
jgi:chromosome segregation ATPase